MSWVHSRKRFLVTVYIAALWAVLTIACLIMLLVESSSTWKIGFFFSAVNFAIWSKDLPQTWRDYKAAG